jgi:hypothetical protein
MNGCYFPVLVYYSQILGAVPHHFITLPICQMPPLEPRDYSCSTGDLSTGNNDPFTSVRTEVRGSYMTSCISSAQPCSLYSRTYCFSCALNIVSYVTSNMCDSPQEFMSCCDYFLQAPFGERVGGACGSPRPIPRYP